MKSKHKKKKLARPDISSRTILVVGIILIIVFLALEFPYSALQNQSKAIASTQNQVQSLSLENSQMKNEINKLGTSAEIEHIARRDFGLVSPGQTEYAIIPNGSSTNGSSSNVPLIPNHIVPGGSPSGQQDQLAPTNTQPQIPISNHTPQPGFASRLISRLEFWR